MKKKHVEKKLKISMETLMYLNEKDFRAAAGMSGMAFCITDTCWCIEP